MYTHTNALLSYADFVTAIQNLVDHVKKQRTMATNEGLELYNLGEFNRAKLHLLIAATDGNKEAQYALAEVLRRDAGNMTEEARNWYQKAAGQDHFYALLRLADETSLAKAKALAEANADPAERLLQLYELTGDIESLRKSERAGSSEAKCILAYLYGRDEKLVPSGLTPTAEQTRLLLEAAIAGLPKAMAWYPRLLTVRDKTTSRAWLEKRLQLNDVNALVDYAFAISTEYDMDEDEQEYGYEKDLVKAYALLWLVSDTTRQFKRHADTVKNLATLEAQLTAQEITDAKQQAQAWKLSHPPMSEYRLTYQEF